MKSSQAQTIDASTAKNKFGSLAAKARRSPVEILRHGRLESVLISPEDYAILKASRGIDTAELERLEQKFKQLVTRMQSTESKAAYEALEDLSAESLPGAVKAAIKSRPKARMRALRSGVGR